MAMLMVMSVMVTVAFADNPAREKQPEKIDQQIFENKELNVLGEEEFVADEILVKFNSGVGKEKTDKINSKHGAFVRHTSPYTGCKKIAIPKGKTVAEMVKLYQAEDAVEYAEPNYIAHALTVPNDEYYPYQWHLDDTVAFDKDGNKIDGTNPYGGDNGGGINIEPAWDTTGTGVVVAVIDTGVAYEDYEEFVDNPGRGRDYWITYAQAPDLDGTNFVPGYDFVNDDTHPNDDEGHGTHVTGTIAQTTNNGIGVAGVAFNCSIMPVKVLDKYGSGTYADVADGIIWAANNGAQVISMSLGGPASITLENAVKYAYEVGVTIVCASGNDGSATTVSYPAAYDLYCIAVGATRYDEEVTYYSNGGPSLDLTAPGGQLYIEDTETMLDQNNDGYWDGVLQQTHDGSDYTNFGYYFYQGTSMATPHVSGVAALLISKEVATTPDEVREALQSTAEDKGPIGWDPEYGWGIVDAYAALQFELGPKSPVADAGPDQTLSDADDNKVEEVTLNGSDSYDPDGSIVAYEWREGDTVLGTAEVITYNFTVGTYDVTLTVTDDDNLTDSDESIITVEANKAPIADAGADQTVSDADGNGIEEVALDGSGSDDPDGTITAYEWKNETEAVLSTEVSFTYNFSVGTHNITLTVTDNGGANDSDTALVTVTEKPANVMHIASIDMSTTRIRLNGWYT